MDYRALTTFRESLDTYTHAVKAAPNKPSVPPVPATLREASVNIPPTEVVHELKALPNNIIRPLIICYVCQPPSLRHAALSSSLLNAPKYNNPRNKRNWHKALGHLVDLWEVLESENADQEAISSLRQLRRRVEEALPSHSGNSLPLATLLVTADARLQRAEKLQHRIDEAVALLGDGQLAYTHDGLQEVVQSIWAQIRSEYPAILELTKDGVEGPERDVVITRVEKEIAALRARHTALIGLGFQLPGLDVARGEGRERVDEDEEDEWEDGWEDGWEGPVNFDDVGDEHNVEDADTERATAKPGRENDGIENFLKGKVDGSSARDDIALPPVTDWVAAIKGNEGDKINRLLLDRLEEKAALESNGGGAIAVVRGAGNRGRGTERGRGRRGGKKAGTTARQRLSAALGIKKRKKKSLLD